MSSIALPHLTQVNLNMLCRVLDTAGIFNIDTNWHQKRRMVFGQFLVDRFRAGTTSEADLVTCLKEQFEVLDASLLSDAPSQTPMQDIARWENEGGRAGKSPGSYMFGKRVERDGTWTVYNVFTGIPARYGTWQMEGLSQQVAVRALRTINTPSLIGEH